jgi:hypothetical protein
MPDYRAATLALLTLVAWALLFSTSSVASASCWASNPDGNRACHSFTNASGLDLDLCEDNPGDCEKAGYQLRAEEPAKSKRHRGSRAKSTVGSEDEATDYAGTKDHDSSGDAATGFVMIGLVVGGLGLLAVLLGSLFGLDAGTSILAVLAGFIFGLLGAGSPRRRRW